MLSIDVVGLRRGVVVGHEYDMGRRGDAQGKGGYERARLYMIHARPVFIGGGHLPFRSAKSV